MTRGNFCYSAGLSFCLFPLAVTRASLFGPVDFFRHISEDSFARALGGALVGVDGRTLQWAYRVGGQIQSHTHADATTQEHHPATPSPAPPPCTAVLYIRMSSRKGCRFAHHVCNYNMRVLFGAEMWFPCLSLPFSKIKKKILLLNYLLPPRLSPPFVYSFFRVKRKRRILNFGASRKIWNMRAFLG